MFKEIIERFEWADIFVDLKGKLFKQKIQTKKKTGNISWHKNNDNILTDYRICQDQSNTIPSPALSLFILVIVHIAS